MKQDVNEKFRLESFEQDLVDIKADIETSLVALLDVNSAAPKRLSNAMRHALLSPSKRLRPLILYLVADPNDHMKKPALLLGSAVEMVHTASLILDDLPCMDNAQMRRSKPTTHVVYGQSTAILGAIALLTRAFEVISELENVADETRTRLSTILSRAVGWDGLVAGQELDLHGQSGVNSTSAIENLGWLKTGVLFVAAAEMGAVLREAGENQVAAARRYAKHFGLAFQTLDDILDESATFAELGKDANKDDGKGTLIKLYGANKAKQTCLQHLEIADAALLDSGAVVEPLRALVSRLFVKVRTA
jgi:geranylgeranyl diphosphate synthase, type II